ncbi:MAG: carboxymethylenebutenolidase [Nocardioidaceae bacterium]|nr:carboxymethylenebutenolidase [Nocardioidaceae bacterium]
MTSPGTASTSDRVGVLTDAGEMPAHLWLPEAGTGPGLLLLQEIFGVSDYIKQRGADLAEAGYVVLAPELYWRLDQGPIDESAPDAFETAFGAMQRLDWDTTIEDAVAALEHLRAREEVQGGTGVLGFCFGGGVAFNVAAVDKPDVLVSYYGSAIPGLLELAPNVSAPSLHHFGLADQFIDQATVERVRTAVTDTEAVVQFQTYEGANHAFDNWSFSLHHAEASAAAWRTTVDFLHRELPLDASAA